MRAVLCLAPALLAGCALRDIHQSEPPPRFLAAGARTAPCARMFAKLDEVTATSGVADAQEARIGGFPYLRVNRFLAGDWRPAPGDDAFVPWVAQLRTLDADARRFEIRNLSAEGLVQVAEDARSPQAVQRQVTDCAGLLMERDLNDPDVRARLYKAATVPDDYRTLHRAAGLYPLTSVPFYAGVKRLHDRIGRYFAAPLAALPRAGRLLRYGPEAAAPPDADVAAWILRRSEDNPLRMPTPSAEDRARLFRAFAPIFEIDVTGNYDRIGWPYWNADGLPSIDTTRPAVFTYLSHVRFENKTLLQLNYVAWFPARPPEGPLDLLAGRLDGIHWRVTLDADGKPLLYDSVHNCGCYHLFVPSEKLRYRGEDGRFEEPILIPQTLPWSPGRLVLRVAAGTHYLQRAYFDDRGGGETYTLADYDSLRSLAYGNRRRSLFDDDGLVPGTGRLERFLFWPMGIENPGAMRQRGRHATAFVGRRHFDDPDLVTRYFRRPIR